MSYFQLNNERSNQFEGFKTTLSATYTHSTNVFLQYVFFYHSSNLVPLSNSVSRVHVNAVVVSEQLY